MNKEKLIIFDTTMRDGEQSPGASMTKDEKLRIARQLERMRVDIIEAGFPAASAGDFEAVKAVAAMCRFHLEWTGQILADYKTRPETLAKEGISAEIIDLRCLRPIDFRTIAASVRKTHRLLVVYEGVKTMGIGAEIAAMIAESDVFHALVAPIARLGGADAPIPYNPVLEKASVPQEDDIVRAARRLVREGKA